KRRQAKTESIAANEMLPEPQDARIAAGERFDNVFVILHRVRLRVRLGAAFRMNHLGIILSPVVESDDGFGGLDGRLAGRRFVAFESQGAFEIQFLLEIFVAQVLAPYSLRLVEVF